MLKSILVVAVALALWSSSVTARERWGVGACAVDIKAFCAGVRPGEGRIRSCVKEHLKDLSEPCQGRLARLAANQRVCAADVKEKCANISLRRHRTARITACLKPALANLSDPCKDALAQAVAGTR